MKALGQHAAIKLENSTSTSGIQVKTDGRGIVESCPAMPEIEGKMVLFDERHRFCTHNEYIFVPIENLLGVLEGDEE
jgi:hypothetical protein